MAGVGATILNGTIGFPSSRQMLALAGKWFTVTNPTIGTPVVGATLAAWSATANGQFVISNGAAANGPSIVLDSVSMRLRSTAPTGTLTMQWDVYNETGIVTGTGNVTSRTPVQVNTGLPQTTIATVQAFAAGAITIPAAVGTRRLQTEGSISTGLGIDGDTYVLQFGQDGVNAGSRGLTAVRATDVGTIVGAFDPVVIAPQTTTWLNYWWLTSAANVPSWEYRLSYFEVQT